MTWNEEYKLQRCVNLLTQFSISRFFYCEDVDGEVIDLMYFDSVSDMSKYFEVSETTCYRSLRENTKAYYKGQECYFKQQCLDTDIRESLKDFCYLECLKLYDIDLGLLFKNKSMSQIINIQKKKQKRRS